MSSLNAWPCASPYILVEEGDKRYCGTKQPLPHLLFLPIFFINMIMRKNQNSSSREGKEMNQGN